MARWRRGRTRARPGAGLPASLEAADAALLRVLDRDMAEAGRRAGDRLACRPGCDNCCHGPFPVTALDGWRLRRGLAALAERDPARTRRVLERARRAAATLAAGLPGDPATGRLSADTERIDAYVARHAGVPCPALDPDSGRCELYDARPVACRTYGPPTRFGDERAAPCELCFVGAGDAEIERCRVEPDADGVERAVLDRLGVPGDEPWATTIAHALIV